MTKLEDIIKKESSITFARLEKLMPEYFRENDKLFTLRPLADYNIWLWTDIDKELADEIVKLINDGKVKVIPVHPIIYIMDGKWLNLPTAKDFSKSYEEPHWLPVMLVWNE